MKMTSKKIMTSTIKKTSKTSNPPKVQACMKKRLREDKPAWRQLALCRTTHGAGHIPLCSIFYKTINMPNEILIRCTLYFAFCAVWLMTVGSQTSTSCVLKKQQLCSKDVNFDAGMHDARKKRNFKKMPVSFSVGLIL